MSESQSLSEGKYLNRNKVVFDYEKIQPEISRSFTIPEEAMRKREIHYKKYLGNDPVVLLHDTTGTAPHVDVYGVLSARKTENSPLILITSGMSDIPQSLPDESSNSTKEMNRIEILWYVSNLKKWMLDCTLMVAKVPFEYKTYYGYWHTISNVFEDEDAGELRNVILCPPYLTVDQFDSELNLEGNIVHFLWMVPITTKEMNWKLEHGVKAWKELLMNMENPSILYDFNPKRKSIV